MTVAPDDIVLEIRRRLEKHKEEVVIKSQPSIRVMSEHPGRDGTFHGTFQRVSFYSWENRFHCNIINVTPDDSPYLTVYQEQQNGSAIHGLRYVCN